MTNLAHIAGYVLLLSPFVATFIATWKLINWRTAIIVHAGVVILCIVGFAGIYLAFGPIVEGCK